jgi:plastocyanin
VLWQFQVGLPGIRGQASTYLMDGEQYVAVVAGPLVWAFKLGGTLPQLTVPKTAPPTSGSSGLVAIKDTDEIETASLAQSFVLTAGHRWATDEYTFNPTRARVKVGQRVTWINNGGIVHTVIADDGSWTTGSLNAGEESYVTFDKPGEYRYHCKNHPWSLGQIIVIAADAQPMPSTKNLGNAQSKSGGFAEQAMTGKEKFNQYCSQCHGADLGGRDAAPALSGDNFHLQWGSGMVSDLFNKIRTTMPMTNPGSLDQQTYLDIVAYLLQANGLGAGKSELNDNLDILKKMPVTK